VRLSAERGWDRNLVHPLDDRLADDRVDAERRQAQRQQAQETALRQE
jgi:hypothetical protein